MAEMSMNKAIHGAFRRDLGRFTRALESFKPGDADRSARLAAAWTQLDDQFTRHHTGEHEIAWPALTAVGVSPELLATFDNEHDAMAAALTETNKAFTGLERNPEQEQIQAARDAVRQLESVVVPHLDHEEKELEPVYFAKKDTPEIKAMGRAFGKVGPAAGGQFFAWLTDGASPDELAAIKASVPGPVLTIMSGVWGRSYRKNIASVWSS